MTDWMTLLNFAGAVAGLTIAVMSLLLAVFIRYMEKRGRQFFIAFFLVLTLYVLSDLMGQISAAYLGPNFTILSRILLFLESFFSSILMPMLTGYLIHCAGEKRSGIRC